MAKAAAKSTTKTETRKPRAPRAKASNNNIETVSEETLDKLRQLGIEGQLQQDIQWCLGSYRADGNPVGLYSNAKKALVVFKNEKEKKTKGVTAKLISDLEKVVQEQPD
jgi:geranylgeranyl pyrophosphate synthase